MMAGKKKGEFQVHGHAAAKKPKTGKKPKPGPVTVTKVPPAAIMLAHELAKGRDVRIEVQRDGSIIIKNGGRKS